ncbi:MAG: flagellar hook-associated protein FlgK [Burkholderiales bacterium]|nr:flagellar hook-associated protein FlgK [Burkholderiales bacterium]
MSNPILGVGISGLAAAQSGLLTTGHNIANVNTDGYSRQEIVQAPAQPQLTGAGYLGRGVSVLDVRRAWDALLQAQSWQSQAAASHQETLAAQLERLDTMLGDEAAGLSPAMDAFFASVNALASHPADAAARQAVLSQAQALAERFHQMNSQLENVRGDLNQQFGSALEQINALARQLAQLNEKIVLAKGRGNGAQLPNDLLDQRDRTVGELSRLIGVVVVSQDDGSYNVFMGNGQPLVIKNAANPVSAIAGDGDPAQPLVALQLGATLVKFRSADISGGKLGGVLEFRDQGLDPVHNALGRIAMVFGAAFNDQHRLGQDANGAADGNFFTLGSPQALAATSNTGSAVIAAAVSDYAALGASDFRLEYDGAGYTLTRLPEGTATSYASLPLTIDGVTLSIASGTLAAGDSFLVRPTRSGAAALSLALASVSEVATAAPVRAAAGAGNRGSAVLAQPSVAGPPPVDPNLGQPVTLTFTSSGSFDVSGTGTGNPTGVAYVSGAAIAYNGWTISLSGAPAAGDVFTVGPNTGGSGDNRNALALAALQRARLVAGGFTLPEAYAQLVSGVGNRTQVAIDTREAQAAVLSQAKQAHAAVTSVNLDEEAANLMRYQQAYQAAAKVIAIAGRVFDSVLQLGGAL